MRLLGRGSRADICCKGKRIASPQRDPAACQRALCSLSLWRSLCCLQSLGEQAKESGSEGTGGGRGVVDTVSSLPICISQLHQGKLQMFYSPWPRLRLVPQGGRHKGPHWPNMPVFNSSALHCAHAHISAYWEEWVPSGEDYHVAGTQEILDPFHHFCIAKIPSQKWIFNTLWRKKWMNRLFYSCSNNLSGYIKIQSRGKTRWH